MNGILPHLTYQSQQRVCKRRHTYQYYREFLGYLKRGIMGQFHWGGVSKKYLRNYIDEFCYRYNAREIDSSSVFTMTLSNMLKN